MKSIKNISIKNKIIFIIFIISAFILTIGFTIIILNNISNIKENLKEDIVAESKLAGEYCVTALEFGYPEKAEENLSKLNIISDILNCIIYDVNDSLFAGFHRDNKVYLPQKFENKSTLYFIGDYLHVWEPIEYKGKKYGMVYIRAYTSLSQKVTENLKIMIYLIGGLLVIALTMALWFQRFISNPILYLAETTKKISDEGDYSVRVSQERKDEIGVLYEEFNKMLDQIKLREKERNLAEQKLRESELRYRRLSDNAQDMIYRMKLPEGNYEYISPAINDLMGFTPEDFYRQPKMIQNVIHPDWQNYFATQWNNLLKGEMPPSYEYQIIHKSGKIKWLYQRNVLVKNENGEPIAIEGIVTDITKRKEYEHEIMTLNVQLEKRVKERTLELEKAYNELADFAYITSHDLTTPLRGISQPAHWLLEDYGHCFDAPGMEMMELILGRVKRMENLINGILEYLKFGNAPTKAETIIIKDIINQVIESLNIPDNITITISDNLPIILSDRLRIGQIFKSLIGNANKFINREDGQINIEFEEVPNFWQFVISDNGPGIDSKYHEKIFGIFQTLDSKDTTENIGIGLSIAKKIVEQLGGSIWLKSSINSGSSFYFTIQKTMMQ